MYSFAQDKADGTPIGMLISGDAALSSPTLLAQRARTRVADLMQQPVALMSMEGDGTGPAIRYHGVFDGALFATFDRTRITEKLAIAVIAEQTGATNIRTTMFPDRSSTTGVEHIADSFGHLVAGAVNEHPDQAPTAVAHPLLNFLVQRAVDAAAALDAEPGAARRAWQDQLAHVIGQLMRLAAEDGPQAVKNELADIVRVAGYYAGVSSR